MSSEPVESSSFEDITQKFFDACSELEVGECVFMPGHDYSTAVHALELMDPRVDSGMERYVPPVTLRSLIAEKYFDKIEDDEVLAIIDATLSCYVAWIDGANICNSLYTNILLAEPMDIVIPHLVLDTLAKIFQHIVPLTVALIRAAGIGNEEDFVETLPFVRANICDWDTVMTQIGEIDKMFRGPEDGPGKIEPIKRSICLRLQWLRLYVEIWMNCLPPYLEDVGILYADPGYVTNFFLCQAVTTALRRTARLIADDRQTGLMRCDEEGKELDFEHDGDFSWLRVFDPKYTKMTVNGGFPRPVAIPNRQKALGLVTTFSDKMLYAVGDMYDIATTVGNVFGILSSLGNDELSFLQRAMYQVLIQPINGLIYGEKNIKVMIKEAIFEETKSIAFKEGTVISHSMKCQTLIEELVTALAKSIGNLFRVMGLNNSRRRNELVKVIDSISNVWPLADELERFIIDFKHGAHEAKHLENSMPVHNWMSSLAVQLTKYYYELSFDLKMYPVIEYEIMFRAYAVVLESRCKSIGNLIIGSEEMLEKLEKAKKRDVKKIDEVNAVLEPTKIMHCDLAMRKEFALGVFLASMAMRKCGFIAPIYWDEDSERLTLEERLCLVRNVPYLPMDYDKNHFLMRGEHYATMAPKFIWAEARFCFANAEACIRFSKDQSELYKEITTIAKKNAVVCDLARLSPERRVSWKDDNPRFPLLTLARS